MDNNNTPPGSLNTNSRRRNWCFTYNKPLVYDETFTTLKKKLDDHPDIRYWVFQEEQGELGTRHFQGKRSLFKVKTEKNFAVLNFD